MRDGLYRVELHSQLRSRSGVIVAQNGRLWGGDAGLYWVGTYRHKGESVEAELRTNRHTRASGSESVWGPDRVNAMLEGAVMGDIVELTGTAPEVPDVTVQVTLSRLSD